MPTHLWIPDEPVSLLDRADAHAVEVTVATGCITLGGVILWVTAQPAGITRTPLSQMPEWVTVAIGLAIILGGILSLVGLLVTRRDISREITTEQAGWILIAAGWGAYSLAVLVLVPQGAVSAWAGGMFTFAGLWRVRTLWKLERRTRRMLRQAGLPA